MDYILFPEIRFNVCDKIYHFVKFLIISLFIFLYLHLLLTASCCQIYMFRLYK